MLVLSCGSSNSKCDNERNQDAEMSEIFLAYRNDPKFSDRYALANSADPDQTAPQEQSDQGLHCLPFRLHRLD